MDLTGTLDRFPLRELLEMMQYSSMCGVLEIEARDGTGCIYAKDGLIYHATYDGETGNLALWLLFEELDARFHVRAGVEADGRSLSSDLAYLMTEGEQRAERWRAIRRRIPNLRMVPVFADSQSQVRIDEADWPVMAAIDGQRTISDLAAYAFIDTLDTCRILIRLLDAGLIRLQAAGAEAAQPAWAPPASPAAAHAAKPGAAVAPVAPRQGGLFKRPLGTAAAAEISGEPDKSRSLLGRLRESLPGGSAAATPDEDPVIRALRGA